MELLPFPSQTQVVLDYEDRKYAVFFQNKNVQRLLLLCAQIAQVRMWTADFTKVIAIDSTCLWMLPCLLDVPFVRLHIFGDIKTDMYLVKGWLRFRIKKQKPIEIFVNVETKPDLHFGETKRYDCTTVLSNGKVLGGYVEEVKFTYDVDGLAHLGYPLWLYLSFLVIDPNIASSLLADVYFSEVENDGESIAHTDYGNMLSSFSLVYEVLSRVRSIGFETVDEIPKYIKQMNKASAHSCTLSEMATRSCKDVGGSETALLTKKSQGIVGILNWVVHGLEFSCLENKTVIHPMELFVAFCHALVTGNRFELRGFVLECCSKPGPDHIWRHKVHRTYTISNWSERDPVLFGQDFISGVKLIIVPSGWSVVSQGAAYWYYYPRGTVKSIIAEVAAKIN